MNLYHRTYAADSILADGFKDAEGRYFTTKLFRGVWFSAEPLDIDDGVDGDVLLSIEIPENLFAEYEWVEEGKPYRESLIPAEIVNKYGPPQVHEDFREEELKAKELRKKWLTYYSQKGKK